MVLDTYCALVLTSSTLLSMWCLNGGNKPLSLPLVLIPESKRSSTCSSKEKKNIESHFFGCFFFNNDKFYFKVTHQEDMISNRKGKETSIRLGYFWVLNKGRPIVTPLLKAHEAEDFEALYSDSQILFLLLTVSVLLLQLYMAI